MRPHDAIALCPSSPKAESVTAAARLNPERKTAFPSMREKLQPATMAPTVPSKSSTPLRSRAQSPPLGTPLGSMKVGAPSTKVRPRKDTFATGAEDEPERLK